MRYYPLFLDLTGRRCLLCGYGGVGRRKLSTLLEAGAEEALVVDPAPREAHPPEARALLDAPNVVYARRSFQAMDLEDAVLCIAATGSPAENQRIAAACREAGVLVNVIDAPETGDFIVPASVDVEGLTVALSTGGQSPALARAVREDLEALLRGKYGKLAALLGRLRPRLLALGWSSQENAAVFRDLARSELGPALAAGDADRARVVLAARLPAALQPALEELLHELV